MKRLIFLLALMLLPLTSMSGEKNEHHSMYKGESVSVRIIGGSPESMVETATEIQFSDQDFSQKTGKEGYSSESSYIWVNKTISTKQPDGEIVRVTFSGSLWNPIDITIKPLKNASTSAVVYLSDRDGVLPTEIMEIDNLMIESARKLYTAKYKSTSEEKSPTYSSKYTTTGEQIGAIITTGSIWITKNALSELPSQSEMVDLGNVQVRMYQNFYKFEQSVPYKPDPFMEQFGRIMYGWNPEGKG